VSCGGGGRAYDGVGRESVTVTVSASATVCVSATVTAYAGVSVTTSGNDVFVTYWSSYRIGALRDLCNALKLIDPLALRVRPGTRGHYDPRG
jgi:hypothetical protein